VLVLDKKNAYLNTEHITDQNFPVIGPFEDRCPLTAPKMEVLDPPLTIKRFWRLFGSSWLCRDYTWIIPGLLDNETMRLTPRKPTDRTKRLQIIPAAITRFSFAGQTVTHRLQPTEHRRLGYLLRLKFHWFELLRICRTTCFTTNPQQIQPVEFEL